MPSMVLRMSARSIGTPFVNGYTGVVNLGRGYFSYPLTVDESMGVSANINRHMGG